MTRERVEPGIWRRGEAFEITWRDAQGKQRRKTVQGGITAARKALTDAKSKRHRGERTSDPRPTFTAAADAWCAALVVKPRPTTQNAYSAALRHLRAAFRRRRLADIGPTEVARYAHSAMRRAGPSRARVFAEASEASLCRALTVHGKPDRKRRLAQPQPVAEVRHSAVSDGLVPTARTRDRSVVELIGLLGAAGAADVIPRFGIRRTATRMRLKQSSSCASQTSGRCASAAPARRATRSSPPYAPCGSSYPRRRGLGSCVAPFAIERFPTRRLSRTALGTCSGPPARDASPSAWMAVADQSGGQRTVVTSRGRSR
jgi:hypothetical protein